MNKKDTAAAVYQNQLPLLERFWVRYALAVAFGLVNFGLAMLTKQTFLPFYFDSIATIGAAVYIGLFPGIVTAVVSNAMLAVFSMVPFPFVLCNISTALIAGLMVNSGKFKNKEKKLDFRTFLWMGVWISLSNGILGSIISMLVFGGRIEGTAIDSLTMGFYITLNMYIPAVFLAGIVTNLLDKLASVVIIFLCKPLVTKRPLLKN